MKKVFIGLVLVILIFTSAIYIYLINTKPVYEGELSLAGLQAPVTVNYDGYGIPHIYAESIEDAYFSLGYLQAQEKLFQMEMIRRIATGRLAEVLGDEFLETDKLFRTLSIDKKSDFFYEQFLANDADYKAPAIAYFEGINAYVENGPTPIEYTAIGIPKEVFSVKDAYTAAGYMSFGFADGFKVDPLTSKIALTLGTEYLDDIGLHTIYDSSYVKSYLNEESLELTGIAALIDTAKLPLFHGSNSWIVSADKSVTGFPLFENDTHIGFTQPSVWYEAHIEYPGESIFGHYLGGFPFAILGHNQFAAWGITIFENDDVDLYQEQLDSLDKTKVVRNGKLEPLVEREETILVKDKDPIKIKVRSSDHGPIINDVLLEDSLVADPVSVYWGFLHANNDILSPIYTLGVTSNISMARKAASEIEAPGLNIMYADKDGNIAWWASARLPIRPTHVNSKLILDGTGIDDYLGYYLFSENPQAENPPWGFVYSANNQPDSVNGVLYPGYYRPIDRASRITNLLESKSKWTVEELKEMTADVVSTTADTVSKEFVSILSTLNTHSNELIIETLANWDGDHQIDESGPSIYYNLLSWTLYHAMADELGYNNYQTLVNLEVMKRSYLMLLQNENSVWWDNINTSTIETRNDIVEMAAASTLKTLLRTFDSEDVEDWSWGKIHSLTQGHPLGKINALKSYFNVGPFPAPGGNEVINNMLFKLDTTGLFPVFAGSSMRTIIDMGDINSALSINPTGQSGNFMSKYYKDQAEKFINVEFRPQLMDKNQIEIEASSTLVLHPKEET